MKRRELEEAVRAMEGGFIWDVPTRHFQVLHALGKAVLGAKPSEIIVTPEMAGSDKSEFRNVIVSPLED